MPTTTPTDNSTRPLSVIVPTVGRVSLLRACLQSVLACRPGAQEVVVVDQSADNAVAGVLDELGDERIRRVPSELRGAASAVNVGLREAGFDTVLLTHDDTTVPPDWVESAWAQAQLVPGGMVTGRVLPVGDAMSVPSVVVDPVARDWTGTPNPGVVFPANLVASRSALLAIGGFDERRTLRTAGEDNDLCYRWVTNGGHLRYEPDMVVWHHDWRTPEQLETTYRRYARGQGAFYGKHLASGDRRVLAFLYQDLRTGLRAQRAARQGRERWTDPGRPFIPWVLVGVAEGAVEQLRLRVAARRRHGVAHRSVPKGKS